MDTVARRRGTRAAIVLAAIGLLLGLVGPVQAAEPTGWVAGEVLAKVKGVQRPLSGIKVRIFTADWGYLREARTSRGAYSLDLAPGSYILQFTDTRPRYDVGAHVDRDVRVTVEAGEGVQRDVLMRRGGAFTGRVTAGGRRAAGARVVAVENVPAGTRGRTYEVTANGRGEYAVGGLPNARFTLFTYDRAQRWSARGRNAGAATLGRVKVVHVAMGTRAGSMVGRVYRGDATLVSTSPWVTLVHRSTGQYWVVKAAQGRFTVHGLYPGTYRITVPGTDGYLGRTANLAGSVRPGRTLNTSVRLTDEGGRLRGRVVDATTGQPARGVKVSAYDGNGVQHGKVATDDDGWFTVGGTLPTATCDVSLVIEDEVAKKWVPVRLNGLNTLAGVTVAAHQPLDAGGTCRRTLAVEDAAAFALVRSPAYPWPTATPTPTATTPTAATPPG
jgi:hypothetical protein